MSNRLAETTVPAGNIVAAHYQPVWPDPGAASRAGRVLAGRSALVPADEIQQLGRDLRLVADRGAVVLQSGDCAELFAESGPEHVRAKASLLHATAELMTAGVGLPVVRIGRMAGQYAKPRSLAWDVRPDGTILPSYLGDAINDQAPDDRARTPDPERLLRAHDHAAEVLTTVRGLPEPVYVSHEMLLLEYERPLVRDGYATSGHFLWIGERTRATGGPHVALAATVLNPIGVKLGPAVSPQEAVDLSLRLNPAREPGRLTFIVRMGAEQITHRLPPIVAAVARHGAPVIWLSDPMHGNGVRAANGLKTRIVATLKQEVREFVRILCEAGEWPGGLHLEATPDDVRECVGDAPELPIPQLYRTACDPRLNPAQTTELAHHFAELPRMANRTR